MPPVRAAACKHWCFTINNPTFNSDELETILQGINAKYVFQLERGEQDTRHFQGYLVLPTKQRLAYLRRCVSPRGHYESANGSPEQNIGYCTKQEGRVEPPRIRGLVLPGEDAGGGRNGGRGRNGSLDAACALLQEEGMDAVVRQYPGLFVRHFRGFFELQQYGRRCRSLSEPPEVVWVYGTPNSGKSTLAALSEPKAYRKNNGQWWDGYDGHPSIIWDDFAGNYPFRSLLTLLDKFGLTVEIKGRSTQMMASRFIFTSNKPPWTFYQGIENTMPALLRRITLYVYKLSYEETYFYENDDDAKASYIPED